MKSFTILGLDPGKSNFAFAVTEVKLKLPFRYRFHETGMIENTVTDLTGALISQKEAFKAEIGGLIAKYDVDVIVAERFMNRGRMGGNTGELVSFMLGVLSEFEVEDLMLLTAAQWKNAFNRVQDLDALYKESELVPHRIDAANISIYGASVYLDVKPFEFLESGYGKFKKGLAATM
jgi:hypothetical protein